MIRKSFFYLFFISALAFFYVTCSAVTNAQTYQGKVIKVTDGVSINILHEGKPLRIRLAEIDAPERGQPFWKLLECERVKPWVWFRKKNKASDE